MSTLSKQLFPLEPLLLAVGVKDKGAQRVLSKPEELLFPPERNGAGG